MNISGYLWKRSQNFKHARLIGRQFFSTISEEQIEIPKRIPRGPTDILRALESTITRDPTAAHFKYHDDPFLIPMSNISKRSYAMAQEAGRKAARWVRKENANLFNHQECDPPIEAFFPKMVYDANSEVTEEDLISVIEKNQVSDAILINKLLETKGIDVSYDTQQSLLELLCYNNNDDILDEELIEERWFKQSSRLREKQRKTWKDGNAAEEIFMAIDNPTAESYSALIQGMAKHYQVDRAMHLFEEAQQKGFVLNVDTYNAIIRVANFLKEGYDLRWALVGDMLEKMRQAELRPNLGTLNAILLTLSTMGTGKHVKGFVFKTLREFHDLGIEPCLGSWYYVLITFCRERGPRSTILNNIMAQVENKNHQISDLSDTNFFVTAMDICRNHLHDLSLGERVHKLLLFGNNYNLIGDSYKESIYYRHYFFLLLANSPLEEFMEHTYHKLVPHIYVPEPAVMNELLNQVELNGAIEYIPKLWSDLIVFNHSNRENLVDLVLNIMISNEPPQGSELRGKFSNIGWEIYTTIEEQDEERFNTLSFTGEMLGKIMTVVLMNNEFDRSCTIMDKLDKGHSKISGVPKFEALSLYVDHCIKNNSPSRAIACIQYCCDCGFQEAVTLAARLNEKLTLAEDHLNHLSNIVGSSQLKGLDVKDN